MRSGPFACQAKRATPSTPSASAAAVGVPAASDRAPRRPEQQPQARERSGIPTGSLRSGSVPGDPGRVPELEPKNQDVELGPYDIDRLPYPNDPALPPLLGKSRDEARRLCAEQHGRLCSELEWERACKGPKQDPYPSGSIWDPSCTAGAKACASGFDVLGLGTGAAEWVAGDIVDEGGKRLAMLRGAGRAAAAAEHRCAARHPTEAATESQDVGFRCCYGAPNAAAVSEPKQGVVFSKTKLTAEELERALAADPAGKALAHDVKFFHEPEGASTVVARGPATRRASISRWRLCSGTRHLAPKSCSSPPAPAIAPLSSRPSTSCRTASTAWPRASSCRASPARSP